MTLLLLINLQIWLLKNRILARVRRLKQPRYLVGTLVGLAYITFVLRPWNRGGPFRILAHQPQPPAEIAALIPFGLATILTVLAVLAWIWPHSRAALDFSEAEVAFLFTAPLSRKQVIDYSLLRSQIGILFTATIVTVFGLPWFFLPSVARAWIGVWALLTLMRLYTLGVAILQSNLAQHGASGLRRSWPAVLAGAAFLGSQVMAFADFRLHPPPAGGARLVAAWALERAESFPLNWILLPARTILRPLTAPTAGAFALSLVPVAVLLAAAYLWVIRSEFAYEEASAERAAQRAERRAARARGERRFERRASSARRAPFPLSPRGSAAGAIFWKNLVATWRVSAMPIILTVVAGVAVASAAFGSALAGSRFADPAHGIGLVLLINAGVFTLMGPEMVRTDLRMDLLQVDLLRSYPVTGPALFLAEAGVPAVMLTALTAAMVVAGIPLVAGMNGWSAWQWSILGAGVLLFVAPLHLLLAVIHNAFIVLFPSWHTLGAGKARGFDVMGQVLLSSVIRILVLGLALLPSAALAALILWITWPTLHLAAVPIAAVAGAIPVLVEAFLGAVAAGYMLERFDPSKELDALT